MSINHPKVNGVLLSKTSTPEKYFVEWYKIDVIILDGLYNTNMTMSFLNAEAYNLTISIKYILANKFKVDTLKKNIVRKLCAIQFLQHHNFM